MNAPHTTAAALAAALNAAGYRQGPPPWLSELSRGIDREVCAEGACPACGHRGLTWQPWHHARSRSYVALSLCSCGAAFEF